MAVAMTSRVARSELVLTAAVDDDLVIMDPRSDCYTALDSIGRRVWELLERTMTVSELCARLGDEYDGEPQAIANDVLAFLGELVDGGLIALAHD